MIGAEYMSDIHKNFITKEKNYYIFFLLYRKSTEPEGEKNTSLKYFRCKYLLNTMIYRDRVLFDLHKIQLLTNSHV